MKKKEDDAGGKCEAVCGVANNARKGVPRAPGGHRMQKRKAQKAYVHGGTQVLDDRILAEKFGFVGEEAGDDGGVEGKEKHQSGGVERHSGCRR